MFDEKNIQFLISKGISLYKLKKFSEAVDYFNEAIKINPLYCTAWCNKGVVLDKLGQHNEALDCFNEAI
nr:tetratricopeptide repeat protein [Actinomycetota bacterium]